MAVLPHDDDPEVIVFNLKRRYTGVSATVNALVPQQLQHWRLAYCGTPLPEVEKALAARHTRALTWREAVRVSRQPPRDRPFRIWHVRRDPEMMAGLWARDVLRLPIRLVFTSAAQHRHGWFPRWLISRMDAVIATTAAAAACVPNTSATVPHGIDLQRFAPVDKTQAWRSSGLGGELGIGVFGRVRPDKGTDIFVDALCRVLPQHPKATAVIAGLVQPRHQAYADELRQRIAAAGLSERIVWLGEVPADQIAQWYRRCTIAVACPRYEPFGLTPFEAAATGCALICSDTGAFSALIQTGAQRNGHLIPTDDAPALAHALSDLLQHPAATRDMGQHAAQAVRDHFSLTAEAQGIAEVYRRLWAGQL